MGKIPRDLIKHLEWIPGDLEVSQPEQKVASPPRVARKFLLKELKDSYLVQVPGHGKFEITGSLLKSENPRHQSGWSNYTRCSREVGTFGVASAPTYMMLFNALYENREVPEHAAVMGYVRTMLHDAFTNYKIATLTQIKYDDSDLVMHNIGQNHPEVICIGVKGSDNSPIKTALDDMCNAVFGVGANKLHDIFDWITNGRKPYFRRVTVAPVPNSRAVMMGLAGTDRLELDASVDPLQVGYALGVREVVK